MAKKKIKLTFQKVVIRNNERIQDLTNKLRKIFPNQNSNTRVWIQAAKSAIEHEETKDKLWKLHYQFNVMKDMLDSYVTHHNNKEAALKQMNWYFGKWEFYYPNPEKDHGKSIYKTPERPESDEWLNIIDTAEKQ